MKFYYGIALAVICMASQPASAQQAEGEWRVIERPNGAMLVRLWGYETNPEPDLVFECFSGKKEIEARSYLTSSLDTAGAHLSRLLEYASDARVLSGCDKSCKMVMKRFEVMEGDKPRFPKEFALGTTTARKVTIGFEADIMDESNYAIYESELPAIRQLWRTRLSIFKTRCNI